MNHLPMIQCILINLLGGKSVPLFSSSTQYHVVPHGERGFTMGAPLKGCSGHTSQFKHRAGKL